MSLGKSILNDSVLSLHIAKLAQTLSECLDAGQHRGKRGEHLGNPRDFVRLRFGYYCNSEQCHYERD
jgi:hypothetical protein